MVVVAVRVSKTKTILHYPRLDTVLMVEKAIRNADEYPTKHKLWRSLPKQVQYQTLCYIVDYLEDLGKIIIKDGQIIWVWSPGVVKEYLTKKRHLIVRSSDPLDQLPASSID